ncbi:MAG: hypothetical protein KF819_27895 [Labilithrix sp.]|nr:hypothetical protein [Labilithrix sp.]
MGCSADGGAGIETETDPTETPPDAVLPPPSGGGDAGKPSSDAGTKDSGGKPDTGVDAGPPPPTPGTACLTDGAKASRACGACGTQEAVCLDEGSGLKWTEYGACGNELAGGCVPGTVVDEPCGNCGTVKKTCTKYCAYTSGACTGQPAMNCKPTTVEYSTAGCPASQYRNRLCGTACTWGSYSACDTPTTPNKMTLSTTVNGVVSADWALSGTTKRPSGTCPSTISGTSLYPYSVVEVHNPTAQTIEFTAYQSKSATGQANADLVMWTYNGNALPMNDAALGQCVKGVEDYCVNGAPVAGNICGNTGSNFYFAAIEAISVPPGGHVLVYSSTFGTSTSIGDGTFTLSLRTTKRQ